MDSATDLDAPANVLQVADDGGMVRGGGVSQKLSKNRKSPYLQDPHAPVPVMHCAEMIMELFADFPSATAGISTTELSVSTSSPTQGPSSSMTITSSSSVSGIATAGVPGGD